MKVLRHQARFTLAIIALFIAQLFVPLAFAGVWFKANDSDNFSGIIICTTTGLKQLTSAGKLVPIGEHQNPQGGQNECLICFTNGLSDCFDTPELQTTLANRTLDHQKMPPAAHQLVLSGLSLIVFKARAPPFVY